MHGDRMWERGREGEREQGRERGREGEREGGREGGREREKVPVGKSVFSGGIIHVLAETRLRTCQLTSP